MSAPAAGWYDDPSDSSLHRRWDGSAWTHDTQPRSEGPAAGWYEDPDAADARRWWDGSAWGETETGPVAEAFGASADEPRTHGQAPSVVVLGDLGPAAAVLSEPVPVVASEEDRTSMGTTRRRLVLVLALAVVLAVGGWFVWQRVSAVRLAEPASTAAEQAWVDAGRSLGEAALQQAIASDRLDAYCEGTYATIAGSGDDKLAGVQPDRARLLFTSSCLSVARGLPTNG